MKNRRIVLTKPFEVAVIKEDFNEKDLLPTEVAIRTKCSLISAGTELACYMGNAPWFTLPGSPGYLNLGEIIETGKDVKGFKKGDIVYSSNSHQEFHKYDTLNTEDLLMKVPEGINNHDVCFGRMGAVSLTGLRASTVELGDFVGVTGLGIIGNLAAQLAQLQGGTVIAMDLSEKRLKIAGECGIEYTVNISDKEVLKKKVMEITGEKGISTFIEATGMSEAVPPILPFVSRYGEVIMLGTPRTEYKADLTNVFKSIHNAGSSVTYKGAHSRSIPFQPDIFVKHSHIKNLEVIFNLIKRHKLNVRPMISHVLKPEDVKKAYEGLINKKDEFIAVVFDWS